MEVTMNERDYYVGIDIANADFTANIIDQPGHTIAAIEKIENRPEGFRVFTKWLGQHGVTPANSLCCLENTGVYGESLSYYLLAEGYFVSVVPPHLAKKAFTTLTKNDRIDAQQLAEYAYRYRDRLKPWKPLEPVLEQIKVLYATREHFTRQLIGNKNALIAIRKKVVQTPLANDSYESMIKQLTDRIEALDKEIEQLVDDNPTFKHLSDLADSAPGVGKLLANTLMVMTEGFTTDLEHKRFCSRIGIAPHEHQSGSSIRYTPQSLGHGNATVRKLLHLAARSVATHNVEFRRYYLRKLAQGKDKRLIMNNISNKLIKIVFAIIASRTPYRKDYRPINPIYLKGKLPSFCH
jgi:transposase